MATWRDSDEEYCLAVAAALEAAGVGTAGYTQTGGNVHCTIIPTKDGGSWSFGLADVEWAGAWRDRDGNDGDGDNVITLEGAFTSEHENPYGDNPAPPEYVARRILDVLDGAEECQKPMYDRRGERP